MVLGFILGAAILTKQSGWFLVALLPAALILFPRGPAAGRRLAMWAACTAVTLVITGLAYSLQFLTPIFYNTPPIENHHFLGDAIANAPKYLRQNWPVLQAGAVGYLTPPLVLLMLVGAWRAFRSSPRHAALLASYVLLPLGAASIIATIPAPRYLVIVVPILAIFIGIGLVTMVDWARTARARSRLLVPALLALAFAPALYLDALVLADPERAPYPGVDEWQYVTSNQLSGGPLSDLVEELERRARGEPRPTIATYNSFNPGTILVAMNGRNWGPRTRYFVTGTQLDFPKQARWVVIEDRAVGPYHKYGLGIDRLLGRSDETVPRWSIDPLFPPAVAKLRERGFRLVAKFPRPRSGAAVYLYERPAARTRGGPAS
jgi:hypothetical protein